MKRIKLKHGSAMVDENCSKETLDAVHKLSEMVFNAYRCTHCKKVLNEMDLKYGKKSDPILCVTCFTSNS